MRPVEGATTADPSFSKFVERFAELRGLLACPACAGELRLEGVASQGVIESASQQGSVPDQLSCEQCGRVYPIVDGIPVLIAGTKRPRDEGAGG